MRLVIDQSALVRELALVAPAAEFRSTTRRLSHLRLEARDVDVLRLTTKNLEYGMASEVEARITEPGAICLPAKLFFSLVSTLDGEVTICADANHYVTIPLAGHAPACQGKPQTYLAS
jgi:DNA polymerase-3 subunit beta